MIKRLKLWWAKRKTVDNSNIYIYASRKTTFPLEQCNAENLRTGARFNRRRARTFSRRASTRPNHKASMEWNEISAEILEGLANRLEDGQVFGDLPARVRRREIKKIKDIQSGKAWK